MYKRVFVINGSAGVGKDTFVSMVGSFVPCVNISSVDKIKEVAKILGWDGTKDERSRKFLSDLKILSAGYNDYPFKYMCKKIADFYEDDIHQFLFLHVREPNEIQKLKNKFPEIMSVLIKNKNVKQIVSNFADKNVGNYWYDIEINNDGDLSMLKNKAESFVQKYSDSEEVLSS